MLWNLFIGVTFTILALGLCVNGWWHIYHPEAFYEKEKYNDWPPISRADWAFQSRRIGIGRIICGVLVWLIGMFFALLG